MLWQSYQWDNRPASVLAAWAWAGDLCPHVDGGTLTIDKEGGTRVDRSAPWWAWAGGAERPVPVLYDSVTSTQQCSCWYLAAGPHVSFRVLWVAGTCPHCASPWGSSPPCSPAPGVEFVALGGR